jgi:hypothetical protein
LPLTLPPLFILIPTYSHIPEMDRSNPILSHITKAMSLCLLIANPTDRAC